MSETVYVRTAPAPMVWFMRHILPGWVALTIGRSIFVARDLTDAELRHEMTHVGQWEQYGWTFAFHYLWANIRYGYQDNPFEIEARGD